MRLAQSQTQTLALPAVLLVHTPKITHSALAFSVDLAMSGSVTSSTALAAFMSYYYSERNVRWNGEICSDLTKLRLKYALARQI